jgi:hypothetical protein
MSSVSLETAHLDFVANNRIMAPDGGGGAACEI